MPKFFAVLTDDGAGEERYDDLDGAVVAAKQLVTEEPDSEVEIVQVLKKVSSSLQIDIKDVE